MTIYAEHLLHGTSTFEPVPPDEAEMGQRMAALVEAGYPYFVAERDRHVVGFGFAAPHRQQPAFRNTVEDSIYLARDARGQGIGGALLRALIEECSARGFRQMVAVIGGPDDVASVRLHRAAGFLEVGTLQDIGFRSGWFSAVVMQRPLGMGGTSAPNR